jgi:hypothetical protein
MFFNQKIAKFLAYIIATVALIIGLNSHGALAQSANLLASNSNQAPASVVKAADFNQLIEIGANTPEKVALKADEDDTASRIITYMKSKGYKVFTGAGNYNIVYVEGMDEDGSVNDDRPNEFNDRRIVIEILDDVPVLKNHWQATSEPGTDFIQNPLQSRGAALIKFGQYQAWSVGIHTGVTGQSHEALKQVANITVHRDVNRDGKRTGDPQETGIFGINQHHAYNASLDNVARTSAGCLVGRRIQGHQEFMDIVKSDNRYQRNRNYVFYTTVINGDDLEARYPKRA